MSEVNLSNLQVNVLDLLTKIGITLTVGWVVLTMYNFVQRKNREMDTEWMGQLGIIGVIFFGFATEALKSVATFVLIVSVAIGAYLLTTIAINGLS